MSVHVTMFSRAQVYQDGGHRDRAIELYERITQRFPEMTQAQQALKQLRERGMKVRAMDGLGDDAVFLEADGETPSGTLFVRVGHWRVVITRDADPKTKAESTLPTLTAFAKAAIPKLRGAG